MMMATAMDYFFSSVQDVCLRQGGLYLLMSSGALDDCVCFSDCTGMAKGLGVQSRMIVSRFPLAFDAMMYSPLYVPKFNMGTSLGVH